MNDCPKIKVQNKGGGVWPIKQINKLGTQKFKFSNQYIKWRICFRLWPESYRAQNYPSFGDIVAMVVD